LKEIDDGLIVKAAANVEHHQRGSMPSAFAKQEILTLMGRIKHLTDEENDALEVLS
jgi:hypothetical protein